MHELFWHGVPVVGPRIVKLSLAWFPLRKTPAPSSYDSVCYWTSAALDEGPFQTFIVWRRLFRKYVSVVCCLTTQPGAVSVQPVPGRDTISSCDAPVGRYV